MDQLSKEHIRGVLRDNDHVIKGQYFDKDLDAILFKDKKISERTVISYEIQVGKTVIFDNCEFLEELKFSGSFTCNSSLQFIRCKFISEVSFFGGKYLKPIEFLDSIFAYSSLNFKGGEFENLRIERGLFKGLNFFKGIFNEVNVGAVSIETVIHSVFINWTKINGKIDFFRVFIFEIDTRGILQSDCLFSISECFTQHLIFREFANNGRLRINKPLFNSNIGTMNKNIANLFLTLDKSVIKEVASRNPIFLVDNSLFGKAEFFSIDFFNFSIVCINESNFTDIIISNVKWPEKIYHIPLNKRGTTDSLDEILVFEKKISKEESRLQRESYRQIKYACSRQGDYIGEQHFHSLEMATYNASLSNKTSFWTKLTLSLSAKTSNYGQSVILPLVWLLGGHLFLFILVLLFKGFYPLHFDLQNPTFSGFETAFEKYFVYINPLRRSELSLGGYLIILDILMRIWASYMIYNFIRASRRFIK